MYRIRLHGRGGQGLKTASRMLGTALFRSGWEVQDAPRYGAERRGAPIYAGVRAGHAPIRERGPIVRPDLVVVADDSLTGVGTAGVLVGLDDETVLLIRSSEGAEVWRDRLALAGPVWTLPEVDGEPGALRFVGAACAGAAARCLGVVARETLEEALRHELAGLGAADLERSLQAARAAWDALAEAEGCVREGAEGGPLHEVRPDWIDLPFEDADRAAPDIRGGATSVEVRTGLWRTVRPVIDYERCNRCSWICSTYCPDSAIHVEADRTPRIDYEHCKGCGICAVVCPPHAIRVVPEHEEARP